MAAFFLLLQPTDFIHAHPTTPYLLCCQRGCSGVLSSSLSHSTARWCAVPIAAALTHLGSVAGMARWNLGLWDCREVEPGLFTGASLFDGAIGWVRVQADLLRGTVLYQVGSDPAALSPRIRASVIAGEVLAYAQGSCVITLEAWRTAGMDDARWRRLVQTHETEIDLICSQLAAAASASVPPVLETPVAPAASAPARRTTPPTLPSP